MINLLGLFVLTLNAGAETVRTRISSLDLPLNPMKPVLVLMIQDGRVGKLKSEQYGMIRIMEEASDAGQTLELTLDSKRYITSVKKIQVESQEDSPLLFFEEPVYQPTVVSDLGLAMEYFKGLNPYYRRRSQCFNRAHIWSYELNTQRKVLSMKVFLFFTRKYIREYDWAWWFHVSPYLLVQNNDQIEERVIDYMFMKGPTPMREWTDYFMKSKTECPAVARYSDYENHEEESYCYLIKAPMYDWTPRDLERKEQQGLYKTGFIESEVNEAYRQGF